MKINFGRLRIVLSLILLIGITYLPKPVFSQDGASDIQNLIVNGGFEGGFQEAFGVGYGWGGFSNGNAVVGWNYDDWDAVVGDGEFAQRIEIRDAVDLNRYAGIYQTVSVVPGQQYKLTLNGLIRSEEGDIALSDYGYRLQYAVDYDGDIAWELVPEEEWKELPWDEQPMSDPPDGVYRFDNFETTITARSDKLTLFVRGWKKWLNNGAGIYDLDEISFIGPAPEGFQAPVVQPVSAGAIEQQPVDESVAAEFSTEASETETETVAGEIQAEPQPETQTETTTSVEVESSESQQVVIQNLAQVDTSVQTADETQGTELPVSGQGSDGSINYVVIIGLVVLLVLFGGAVLATMRQQRTSTEQF